MISKQKQGKGYTTSFFIITFGLVVAMYQCRIKNISERNYITNTYNRNKFYEIVKKEMRSSKLYKYDPSVR